jgi:hypothetical protein
VKKALWFRRKNKQSLRAGRPARGLAERLPVAPETAIPAGSRIYASESPKITVAHLKSALNPGAACEAMSQRVTWLGLGSDAERKRAASMRLCSQCEKGDRKIHRL